MTSDQLNRLCTEIANIAKASKSIIDLAKEMGDTDKYAAIRLAGPVSIVAGANELLSGFAEEVKPNG